MVQDLEKSIADARHALETVAQSRRDTQFELTNFIRTRTELECIIEDLRAAGQNVDGKREACLLIPTKNDYLSVLVFSFAFAASPKI